jgi:hypothetical protein
MGLISRLLVPRGIRKAMNPMSALGGAVMPRPLKQARRGLFTVTNPIGAVGGLAEDVVVEILRAPGRAGRLAARQRTAGRRVSADRLDELRREHAAESALATLRAFHRRDVKPARRRKVHVTPVDRDVLRREHERRALQGTRLWHRSERRRRRENAARDAAIAADEEQRALVARAEARQRELDAAWEALLRNERTAVIAALETAFEDEPYSVLGLAMSKREAIALTAFPGVEDVVSEREPATTPRGRPTLRKRSKTARNDLYAEAVAAFTLHVARRALAATPGAAEGAAITCCATGEETYEVIACLSLPRSSLERAGAAVDALTLFAELGGELKRTGRTREVVNISKELSAEVSRLLPRLRAHEAVRTQTQRPPD